MNNVNDLLDLDNSTYWEEISSTVDSNVSYYHVSSNYTSTTTYYFPNTTAYEEDISSTVTSSTKTDSSSTTKTTRKSVTAGSENNQDTLYILLGAISFVFITSLVCIILCTLFSSKRRRKKLQRLKLNKQMVDMNTSSLNVKGQKSSLSASSASLNTSKLAALKILSKQIGSQSKIGSPSSKVAGLSLDSGGFDSWKSTFSALSTNSKSKTLSASPIPSKFEKKAVAAEPKKVTSVIKVESKADKSLIVKKSLLTNKSLITNKSVIGESSKRHSPGKSSKRHSPGESSKKHSPRAGSKKRNLTLVTSKSVR